MGILYVVSTPIGNLEDITIRAIKTLFSADVICCEDTRRSGILIDELHSRYAIMYRYIDKSIQKMVRFDSTKEQQILPQIIAWLEEGKQIALISDAGTPLISDPGFSLVREAIKRGINVVSIPGASAVLTALITSGLPAQPFLFLGYPPEKQSHRIKLFQNLFNLNRFKLNVTHIFYCAPHKLQQTLVDMKEVFGDIDIVVARELTKIHEEFFRGTVSEAESHFDHPKGEFVILLSHPQG